MQYFLAWDLFVIVFAVDCSKPLDCYQCARGKGTTGMLSDSAV
jgi:hypothetical protein